MRLSRHRNYICHRLTRISGRPSAIHHAHAALGVALAGSRTLGRHFVDAGEVFGGQTHFERREVFVKVGATPRAGNGNDVFALREHPGERQLGRLNALSRRKLFHATDEIEVPSINLICTFTPTSLSCF